MAKSEQRTYLWLLLAVTGLQGAWTGLHSSGLAEWLLERPALAVVAGLNDTV